MITNFEKRQIVFGELDTQLENSVSLQDAIIEAKLNYEVALAQLKTIPISLDNTGKSLQGLTVPKLVKNRFATIRTDTSDPLGVVSNRYHIVQNIEAFKPLEGLLKNGNAQLDRAGTFNNGATIFMSLRMNGMLRVKNDTIEKYLLISTSHDGSSSINIGFTPIRIACSNTLNMAIRHMTNKLTFQHSSQVHSNLSQVEKVLYTYNQYTDTLQQQFNMLADEKVNTDYIKSIIGNIIFTPEEIQQVNNKIYDNVSTRKLNEFNSILETVDTGVGQDFARGSKYWLFNGISSYYNNYKSYTNSDKRFNNIIGGTSYRKTQKAFDLITA